MSIAGLLPITLEIMGGKVSDIHPSDLPQGASPNGQDLIFPPGAVQTRPGLASQFAAFAGNPTVNYTKDFLDALLNPHFLMLDGLGVLREEYPFGTISSIRGLPITGAYCRSNTLFGREWMAFSDGKKGVFPPAQYDGTNLDRATQDGPGASPSAQDYAPPSATISPSAAGSAVNISSSLMIDRTITWVYIGGPTNQKSSYQEVYSWSLAQIITATPHGLTTGQIVTISGVTGGFSLGLFNGTFQVTVINSTTFVFSQSYQSTSGAAPYGTANTGTVTLVGFSVTRLNGVVTVNTSAAHGFYAGWTVLISGLPNIAHGGSTGTGRSTGGVVTITTATAHGFIVGQQVVISGASDASFNGTYTVQTVPSPTSFTLDAVTLTASATGITCSSTFDGIFLINSVPSATSFTFLQPGQNESSTSSGTAAIQGNISAGQHSLSVAFITRQGLVTQLAVPSSWISSGGKLVQMFDIPTGPSNIVGRQISVTPVILPPATSGDAHFYHLSTMVINDNVTTSIIVDFSDSTLIASSSIDASTGLTEDDLLFRQHTLSSCINVLGYADRLVWIGENNYLPNMVNIRFDGGWNLAGGTGGADVPLGWTNDPTSGAGGSRDTSNVIFDDAYRMTGDGATAIRGMVSQSVYQDWLGVSILEPGKSYGFRLWAVKGGGITQGNLIIELYSASQPYSLQVSIPISSIGTGVAQLTGTLINNLTAANLSQDLQARIYLNGTPNNGGWVTVDEFEIYDLASPVNNTLARISFADNPEAIDSISGQLQAGNENGQPIVTPFTLLDNRLYLTKSSSLYSTIDDGTNEPALWTITEVSNQVGTPSINGVATGEDWAIIVSQLGAYIFGGSVPLRISGEIQPDWDLTNWDYGYTIYTTLDLDNRRFHVGVPQGAATSPNIELVMDFRWLNTVDLIASYWSVHYSAYSGKILVIGDARKWCPWKISCNCAALVLRSDGTRHLFRGNGTGTGKVYDQITSQLSDDGVAIDSFYETYYMPDIIQAQAMQLNAGRSLFAYFSARLSGAGTLNITAFGPDHQVSQPMAPITLQSLGVQNVERNMNFPRENVSFRLETNAVGAWFKMTKLFAWCKTDPMAVVRGN